MNISKIEKGTLVYNLIDNIIYRIDKASNIKSHVECTVIFMGLEPACKIGKSSIKPFVRKKCIPFQKTGLLPYASLQHEDYILLTEYIEDFCCSNISLLLEEVENMQACNKALYNDYEEVISYIINWREMTK